jgi:hypothetical protein
VAIQLAMIALKTTLQKMKTICKSVLFVVLFGMKNQN